MKSKSAEKFNSLFGQLSPELSMDKYRLVGERRPGEEAAAAAAAASADEGDSKPSAVDKSAQAAAASAGANAGEQASAEGAGGSSGSSDPNEIRITQQGKPRNYISYAIGLFDQEDNDSITLKAMGRAINKCVTITEILKRKMPLHQITKLSSEEIIDVFEPLEEGLDVVESKRYVSCMVVTLSKTGKGMDTSDIGYQAPLPLEDIQPGDFNNRPTFDRSETPTAAGGGGGGGGGGDSTTVMAR